MASSPRAVAARSAERLSFELNPALPITGRREDILAALETSQVLVVAGDTGSGKSTQLPQYCLERRSPIPSRGALRRGRSRCASRRS
jgi:ATP-dependent helicase HrpA